VTGPGPVLWYMVDSLGWDSTSSPRVAKASMEVLEAALGPLVKSIDYVLLPEAHVAHVTHETCSYWLSFYWGEGGGGYATYPHPTQTPIRPLVALLLVAVSCEMDS